MIEAIEDYISFRRFKKDIKHELNDPNSPIHKFKIKKNWLGNILYMQLDCTESDFLSADYSYDRMLENKIMPVVSYLGTELGWGDYLVPQISQFVDEDGEASLSFGVMFIFQGYSLTMTKALFTGLFSLVALSGIVWSICHYLI
jgi:hypothetical protein